MPPPPLQLGPSPVSEIMDLPGTDPDIVRNHTHIVVFVHFI